MIESRQKTMQTFFNLLRFVVIFASGLSLNAKILFVDDNASAGGNGLLWANAFNHLQDALSAATSGDEIWVVNEIPAETAFPSP